MHTPLGLGVTANFPRPRVGGRKFADAAHPSGEAIILVPPGRPPPPSVVRVPAPPAPVRPRADGRSTFDTRAFVG